ncbi:MAG: aminoacetone oxidase family FAD-binding enzyme [Dehalococcoidales bacterium]|nr:aminoacetone oxidase family FAD-binding enzyme [Dehalococcoidales bacterium]
MENNLTVVIGGGAAGICAAISKGRRGEPVIICEKTAQLAKKLQASGNGRCNLLNDNLSAKYYNPGGRDLVKSVFDKFGKPEILNLFKDLGLEVYSQDGRIFPVTNQATSVTKVLEIELRRLSIPIEYNFDCTGLLFSNRGINVSTKDGRTLECQTVIITGGGKTYPAFGSDGSTYEIARQLEHTIVEPVPSAVPLVVKDSLCHILQGQKIFAGAKNIIEGKEDSEVRGELLFTKYGLSGSCILDVSEAISIAINRHHKTEVYVSVDMVPFMSAEQLSSELERRTRARVPTEEMLAGVLSNKCSVALANLFENNDLKLAVNALKNRRFKVVGTRGWNEAEFTAGGVNVDEVRHGTLESKFKSGVYFAGEILDVNGQRGGYNLGWAWASGFVAGMTQ